MKLANYIILALLFLCLNVYADSFSTTLQNDLGYSDHNYTHGTRFMYVDDESEIIDGLFDGKNSGMVYSLAQYMYTPTDLTNSELILDDRPYAGWLYLGTAIFWNDEVWMDYVELDVGVIGPSSFAEDTQCGIHKITESTLPQGWDNQLNDELGINLTYQKKFRWRRDGFIDIDVIPNAGGAVGNVLTYADIGGLLRVGYNNPDDFGALKMEPSTRSLNQFGVYSYLGAESRYIARSIFLDGNTFLDSHNVEKEDFVSDIEYGLGLWWKNFDIIYGKVIRTEEFELQEGHTEFHVIMLSWKF